MSFYNYVLFKPDSQRDFNEILEMMPKNNLKPYKYYFVHDWKKVSEILYKEQFDQNVNFKLSFESLAYIVNNLFGNKGVICIIKKEDNQELQDFVNNVLDFKIRVRERYCKKDEIILVANVDKMPIDRLQVRNNGKIRLIDSNGQLKEVKRYKKEGLYKFHSLSYIHCPDADIIKVLDEMNLLHNEGIIATQNEISIGQLNEIKKYRTFNVTNYKEDIWER